ncbi:MAG: hypothetical protein KBA75_05300 [Alphaproteobacteria bacterium]|nr:hypothetical protein [Alphaproteobacteria bacterium]
MTRLCFALLLALLLSGTAQATSAYRTLDCTAFKDKPRAAEICKAIAKNLGWEWMGHATIAPGFKPSFVGIGKTYCQAKITKDDLPTLLELKNYTPRGTGADWRLESAADMLTRLVNNLDGKGDEPKNSVYHPESPNYLLKQGCDKRQN